jgi:radical SAM superfamily enzyme YgiQ (UPF0313 family)/Fe-S-cluster containining protein
MKICLVSYLPKRDGQIPIGLLTLASIARQAGVQDISVEDLPERQDEDAFIESIREFDVVGFSSICTTFHQTIRLCRRLKVAAPEVLVVLGGPHASLTTSDVLGEFDFVDAIFAGEAEKPWRDFVDAFQNGVLDWSVIAGMAWRNDGRVVTNPPAPLLQDLDELPLPAFDLYDFARNAPVTPVEIGRGCPFSCTFCATSPFFSRRFRLKPVRRIIQEIDLLFTHYGSRSFYFVQDSFSVSRKFVAELCSSLQGHDRAYSWHCSVRADQMSDDMAKMMIEAGCNGVFFGLETGSQRMQSLIKKGLDVKQAVETILSTARVGLPSMASMIVGFPDETLDDLRDTLDVFLELKSAGLELVQIHVLAPLPGSTLSAEGHPLAYDGMPTDFTDATMVQDEEDISLITANQSIFSNYWYYCDTQIPRDRILSVATILAVSSQYFPNTLHLASVHARRAVVDNLLTGDLSNSWRMYCLSRRAMSDAIAYVRGFWNAIAKFADEPLSIAFRYDCAYAELEIDAAALPIHLELPASAGERPGRRLIADFATENSYAPYLLRRHGTRVEVARLRPDERSYGQQYAVDEHMEAALLFQRVCASCGECCFEPGGILCGRDEWPRIHDALTNLLGQDVAARQFDNSDLLVLATSSEPAAGPERTKRRACPALAHGPNGWRCAIEEVKPAGCIAFPLNLVLRAGADDVSVMSLEFRQGANERGCELERALLRAPTLARAYCDQVRDRILMREGAYSLSAYNAKRLREAAKAVEA